MDIELRNDRIPRNPFDRQFLDMMEIIGMLARECKSALFQLQVLWEAKLATLDGSHQEYRQGPGPERRRKYINVELVRSYVSRIVTPNIRLGRAWTSSLPLSHSSV